MGLGAEEDELAANKLGTLTVKTGKRSAPAAEEEEPVSPAARLFQDPGFNCHIVSVVGVGTRIDVDVVRSGLESTLVRHPRFSSIPVFDKKGNKAAAKWVRTKVAIDDHIVIPDLDPAGAATSTSPDRLVEDYASSLCRTPMDASRPLWELHILNFPTSDAAATAVFRIHHSLGDGVSLTSLLLACTRTVSDPPSLPTLPVPSQPLVPRRKPGTLTLLKTFLILVWHTLVDVVLFAATAAFLKDTSTPLKGTAGVAERPKRFVHRIVSLDDIKDVKDAASCTVNDVLLGVTSAALTRYIHRRSRGTGDDSRKKLQLPRNIRLRSTLLVNIRPTTGLHDLSEFMEGKKGGIWWGNWLGYAILPFSVVKYEDPLDYVRKGKAIADRKKSSLEAIFTHKSAMLVVKWLGMRAAITLCRRMLFNTTFSFSNIVGPVEEIGFYGHPIAYLAPSVYGHPHALTVHFQSYKNTMTIVLAVDESAIPDPHQLLDDFAESLKLIKASIPPES